MPMQQVRLVDAISKPQFHLDLRQWMRDTSDAIIGSGEIQGRTPWVFVRDSGAIYKLHADATREAVRQYLGLVDQFGDDIEWTVVPNARGNLNAVAYGPEKTRIVPFYFYLADADGGEPTVTTRYWLTTHWPPEVGSTDPHHRNVYLQDGHESVGTQLAAGDNVLIYESGSGPTELEELADGSKRQVQKRAGRQGIVTAALIKEPLIRRAPKDALIQYADGTTKNWAWMATTEHHSSNGFVPRGDLLRILGLADNYTMRGFGAKNSGLREITKGEYEAFLKVFVSNPRAVGVAPNGKEPRPGHWTEGGGEGPIHLALKEYVAANPEIVLSETGVVTLRMEFPFPSGDRADIALRDSAGRFIGLEVEVAQDNTQIEGLLQAIKYRHMLAVMQGVTFEESRSVLVAYQLGPRIKELCEQYDVQAVELDRTTVEAWTVAKQQQVTMSWPPPG